MGSFGVCEQEWRKGPWTPQEDKLLIQYISQNGEGRWSSVAKCTGMNRSGKSCRLRWVNYLRPGLKKGHLTPQEEGIIIELHALWGNKWSTIARYLPGRTDNEIKNYWRTHFKARKPSATKQEKRKTIRQQQQQQQEQQETDSKNFTNESLQAADDHEKNGKKEAEIAFPTIDNHQYMQAVDQETDFVPFDCYLWGGLWNLDDDDPNGFSKRAADYQNQANDIGSHYYPFEGDAVDYAQNGGFIF